MLPKKMPRKYYFLPSLFRFCFIQIIYYICPKIWLVEAEFICPKIWLADKKAIFFKKLMDDKDTALY